MNMNTSLSNSQELDRLCGIFKRQLKEGNARPPVEYYDRLWAAARTTKKHGK